MPWQHLSPAKLKLSRCEHLLVPEGARGAPIHSACDLAIEELPVAGDMEERWMARALDLARGALEVGEVPVGCVFVVDSLEVASGANTTNAELCATRHAELNAVAAAPAHVDWSKAELYVTCEPCIMCASALRQLRVKRVYFGCANDKFGGCGSILALHRGVFPVVPGIRADEAVALFRQFYDRDNVRTSADVRAVKRRRRRQQREQPSSSTEAERDNGARCRIS